MADNTPREIPPMPTAPKRKRGRPKLSEEEKNARLAAREAGDMTVPGTRFDMRRPGEPGDNARYLQHAMGIRQLPPINIEDPQAVKERIDWYFAYCGEADMKPTVSGFCHALGISRITLFQWKNGTFRAGTHQKIILDAYATLEELWENYMQNGKINPVSGIFLGKNNYGYRDQQSLELSAATTVAPADVKSIEEKYAELPDPE